MPFLNRIFFKNALGLFALAAIWFIFAIVGLRGVTANKSFQEIRQETGFSLLTLFLFVGSLGAILAASYYYF